MGKDIRTILDLGCGNGKLMEAISEGEKWEVVGVDINGQSLKQAKKVSVYKELIKADLDVALKGLIKQKKKFDVVLCSQVIEHLSRGKGEMILNLLNKVVLKRIVISTPNGFLEQLEESLHNHNPYQQHISGWQISDFEKRGYSVKGSGLKIFWSFSGLARSKSKFISVISRVISFLFASVVYTMPFLGVNLIAIKILKIKTRND